MSTEYMYEYMYEYIYGRAVPVSVSRTWIAPFPAQMPSDARLRCPGCSARPCHHGSHHGSHVSVTIIWPVTLLSTQTNVLALASAPSGTGSHTITVLLYC